MKISIPELLAPFFSRPVAIFGEGVSGQAVRRLLHKIGVETRIYDESVHAGLIFGELQCGSHSLVVYSPGFAADHPWLQIARHAGLLCLGELDFSSLFWREQLSALGGRGELIAITGTNGKTTLTEFLAACLEKNGEKVDAVGNIGKPLAQLVLDFGRKVGRDLTRTQFAVCEVSSFQAESLQYFQSDAVLWTNFAEDHLDRHGSLENYFMAKARLLAAAPAESTFVGACVARAARSFGHTLPPYAAMRCEDPFFDEALEGSLFATPPQRDNFRIALAWWRHTGRCPELLHDMAHGFKPAQHRLARVAERDGITYWDDSKATNFNATEGALARFAAEETPVNLILGGRSKGGDIGGFVERIAPRVERAFLIGETAPALAQFCLKCGLPHTPCDSLEEAVTAASGAAQPGEAIVLSPGFASFDCFRDYQERGECFQAAVQALT